MKSKHDELDNLIREKLLELENKSDEDVEKRRLKVLHEAICDRNETIFSKLGIDMAKQVLMFIGIDEKKWFETYIMLREEEEKGIYTLIDIDETKEMRDNENGR